ncbi:hypothetical protein TSAR_013373 [Trichomalopsis sarcophagae]|uniref:Uncharacterized protein n=1 Tax=Trichomalopsis sarcophagae TaxID=543379 RepID=A0A232EP31_9HYME|nr:hypothetical protein TSAR_013373 [Trichomalopsis sarcophagae]
MEQPALKAMTERDETIVVLLSQADNEELQCPLCTRVGGRSQVAHPVAVSFSVATDAASPANSTLSKQLPTPAPPTNQPITDSSRPRPTRGSPHRQQADGNRDPASEQRRLVGLLEAASIREQLKESTALAMQFLGRLTVRRPATQQRERPAPRRRANNGVEAQPLDLIRGATRLQRLYRTAKKWAVQQILTGPNGICQIDKTSVFNHFNDLAARRDYAAEMVHLGYYRLLRWLINSHLSH